jgi:hypothetical protein
MALNYKHAEVEDLERARKIRLLRQEIGAQVDGLKQLCRDVCAKGITTTQIRFLKKDIIRTRAKVGALTKKLEKLQQLKLPGVK